MDLGLPGGSFSGHGIEDGEELSGDRDEGKLGGLARLAESLVEILQDRVEARGGHRRQVERGSDGGSAAADATRSKAGSGSGASKYWASPSFSQLGHEANGESMT